MKFDSIKEALGFSPVPMDEQDEQREKDIKSKTSEEAKQKPEKEPEDNPEQEPEEDSSGKTPQKKKVQFKNIDDMVEYLESKGCKVERRDLDPKNDSKNEPDSTPAPTAPAQSAPTPVPAPYVPAQDTTPKVYQDRHLGVRLVQDGEFYNKLANSAYEFDRLFGHGQVKLDPTIISWIGSLYPDVPELAEDIVKNRLRDILTKNPDLITEVKKIARETREITVPYVVSFVSKLDGTEYESENEAKAAMAEYEKIGATMQTTYYTRYRKRHFDGTRGEIVDESEVIDFARNYDGDLKKLLYELWLSKEKVIGKPKSSDSSSTDDGNAVGT
ncbi:hypothetical protein IJH10_00115 [Candidatus Saccharibacteria bacterium]|nr:hypothetical protein [Candidatus Saccharibacteria bacterium]